MFIHARWAIKYLDIRAKETVIGLDNQYHSDDVEDGSYRFPSVWYVARALPSSRYAFALNPNNQSKVGVNLHVSDEETGHRNVE